MFFHRAALCHAEAAPELGRETENDSTSSGLHVCVYFSGRIQQWGSVVIQCILFSIPIRSHNTS
jgi:hypothetical protein